MDLSQLPKDSVGTFVLAVILGLGLIVVTPLWMADIITRWREAKWSTKRFTPEQYQDFIRRAAEQGARYVRRNGGRIAFLDEMQESTDDRKR